MGFVPYVGTAAESYSIYHMCCECLLILLPPLLDQKKLLRPEATF